MLCCDVVVRVKVSVSGNAGQREPVEQEGVGSQGPALLEEAQP